MNLGVENRTLSYAVLISLLLHAGVLTQVSFSMFQKTQKALREVEIAYHSVSTEKAKSKIKPKVVSVTPPKPKEEKLLLKDIPQSTRFTKDMSQLSKNVNFLEKRSDEFEKLKVERKVTVPPLKSEKINNPVYVSYYQIVRNRIRERAYANYAHFEAGEVYLTFVLSRDGILQQMKLIEEKTSATAYLRDVGLKSVKEATPFPAFPEDLKYPELSFNVVISFELKE